MRVKFFSMFSGVFGFEIGIERVLGPEGYELVGYSQIDPKCKSDQCNGKYTKHTYMYSGYAKCDECGKVNTQHADAICQFHKPGIKNYGDATKIRPEELPDFNFLVGGFPCQAFSVAGERQGFEDTRGTLFFEIARVLEKKRPDFFLLENVEGLVSHDHYRTITRIHSVLTGIGYECQWVVLNSKNFGVPQNRTRVFFLGNIRGKSRPEILSIGSDNKGTNERTTETSVVRCITAGGNTGGLHSGMTLLCDSGKGRKLEEREIMPPLRSNTGVGHGNYIVTHSLQRRTGKGPGGKGKLSKEDQTSYCLDSINSQAVEVIKKEYTKGNPQATRVYDINGISSTMSSCGGGQGGKTGLYEIGNKIRRLTPVECERLQSWPDNWTKFGNYNGKIKEVKDSRRYECIGNGVTSNVIEEIIKIYKF